VLNLDGTVSKEFRKDIVNSYSGLEELPRFPILDNHLHLDPSGCAPRVLKDFVDFGGTHIVVVHKPYRQRPILKKDDFNKSFDITVGLADNIENDTPLSVIKMIGPYPVNLIHLEKKHGLEKAEDIMIQGMELAGKYVEEGKAQGIGEIGRPHFDVHPEIIDASNRILEHGLSIASDLECPVHLHTESGNSELFLEISYMAKRAGCDLDKVVKHFSGPMVDLIENHGLFPSVLASSRNVKTAVVKNTRFVMETDYMDDPKRPGAVMVPKTIPKRTFELISKGLLDEKGVYDIHSYWPGRIYNMDFDL